MEIPLVNRSLRYNAHLPSVFPVPLFSTFLACLAFILPASSQQILNLPGEDRPLDMDQEEVYAVGALAGEEWETFSTISGVAFDQNGNLYLLDRQNFRVVKVDPAGGFLAEMGRSGGGPGEFGMPLGLAVTPGGEVRVYDMGHQGFTIFNPDGTVKGTSRLSGGDMFLPNGGLMVLPDGRMVDGGAAGSAMTVVGGNENPLAPRPVHLLTLGEELEVGTAFEAWNPLVEAGAGPERMVSGGGFQISAPPLRAFDPGLFVGALPDGRLAVADTSTYTVKLVGPEEKIDGILRRPFDPREVTRRDEARERERRLAEIEAREESSSGGGGSTFSSDGGGGSFSVSGGQVSDLLRARVETMEFGEEVPVITSMAVDWEGRIWVARTGPEIGERGPVDLLTSDGQYLGSLPPEEFDLPDAFGPGGLAAWIETGEMDVPQVVVRRITIR